ncbi:Lectin family glycoprotein receptor [Schizosaccharomyces pombe]|uniref:L-type lectin-like domain-containing protein C126.08c n=1 Tax=Schizosaccharomyces pombe (strain 972 / ATCC 24843) TaxID=284812 RepID=YQF8_SCHPO|nr:putative lectin family glycoprotein receptor [Schizosaccharomyces pombe]O94401.1 RecName: Full=L-type lectin-like domain-containing protein C126.08c; Flags: Precursor [Schizosaccharomyces pombe 972h-]CAA22477.1 lectin family glycoprotein receptor (predicted) [Schizosaccharomyces pombe]|eukprot:NP_588451.1 putative lectin family glycoprotein receptor [Schizosaccharomyces pombe]
MFFSVKNVFLLGIFGFVLGALAETSHLERLSLEAPYINHGMRNLWWEYGGSTVIDRKNGIFLTQDVQNQQGWISTRLPTPSSSFEVLFQFRINSESTSLFGDGLAFFLAAERAKPGPVFGFTDKFNGYGIFIDTYNNHRPGTLFPRVIVMKGDGHTPYDYENDGKANEIASCSALNVRGNDYNLGKLKYDKNAKKLRFEIAYQGSSSFIKCFDLNEVELPLTTFMSFSAHTGDLSESHEIASILSRTITDIDDEGTPEIPAEELKGTTYGQKKGSFKKRLIILLLSLIVIFSIFALRSYQVQQEKNRRTTVL